MAQYSANIDLSTLDGTTGFEIVGTAIADQAGFSIASAGDINHDGYIDLIVGAPGATTGGGPTGASYVIYGQAGGFGATFDLSSIDGTNGFEMFDSFAGFGIGRSVAAAGDVNGDGFADMIVGAPYTSVNGNAVAGAGYVVFGKAGGFGAAFDLSMLDGNNGFKVTGLSAHDQAGLSVASAGDINGDGFADLIVGAQGVSENGNTYAGASYVVFGHAGGFAPTLDLSTLDGTTGFTITGAAAQDNSGHSVASAGDINGDGFADLVIGAFGASQNGNPYYGATYVVYGHAGSFGTNIDLSTLDGTNGFKISGVGASDRAGWSVASAGDVNGDGFADIVIGARDLRSGGHQIGGAYVVFGQAGGFGADLDLATLSGSNGFRITGDAHYSYAGVSVASAGDVNGDGFADVIIGADNDSAHGAQSGASYVVFGGPGGFAASIDLATLDGTNGFKISGVAASDYSGISVSSAGDLNGDGLSDLLVGNHGTSPASAVGESYVIYGILPDTAVDRTGTDASQTLVGGHFDDTLNGLGGDDMLYSNGGNDTLNGGDGNDGFAMAATYTPGDHIDGGTGSNNQIGLQGDYSAGVILSSASIVNVQVVAMLPGFNYSLTVADDLIGAGQTMTFWSVTMAAANHVIIDGSLESDGKFDFYLGQGDDTVVGGAGNDLFYGEGGQDNLTGHGGSDTFAYLAPSDSTGAAFDIIHDFDTGNDSFKLPVAVAAIDTTVASGMLTGASFDTDLATAIGASQLAAGHAVLFTPDAGGDAGHTFLVVDANGVAGYQAGQDFVFDVTSGNLAGLSTANFV
jgi:FG-GAP repeat/RTX calcium-binding nonapeptide repeat (4 copies)